ncbi:bacterial transferase hexapeptide [Colletotrichum karsti]|uniref:Bacterial transferase hexapeptide n=1 Tax=Colletotrichum karsti TaxID=1095194 RepID=A0A9P6LQX4_9PEZI|nr:bacterial transferase hexapeptide [Colletotrichum karsti]KAF9882361.1 bacterial transferase hexapeptide [Colletotrichum karsti]
MSAFTALNGGSPPKTSEPTNQPTDVNRASPDERSNGTPTHPEPKPSTAAEPSANQRENWAGPSQDRSPYHSTNYPDVDGTLKRKRSDSPPRRDVAVNQQGSPETSSQLHSIDSRDPYRSPPNDPRSYADREERREHGDSWYSQEAGNREDRSYYDEPSTASAQGHPDEQVGEALRRANQMESQDYDDNNSPDGDDRGMPYSPYTPTGGSRDPSLQSDPKKRKRNFSNRTKTGCLTCRKRKKKCDEQKPECSNCIRGGFICAGYPPQRNAGWQKPDNKAAAIPLESKDPSYVPPGAYGMPQTQPPPVQPAAQPIAQPQPQHPQAPYGTQPAVGQRREPLPPYRGQPLRIDTPQGRPIQVDDERQTASTLSASVVSNPLSGSTLTPSTIPSANSAIGPDNHLSPNKHHYAFPVNQGQSQQSPYGERKEFQRVPPLHDISRTANDPDTPHPAPMLPQIKILQPTRSNSPTSQPPATSNVQVAAQLALSHTQFSPNNRIRTQKEEMLLGRQYFPFDKELVLERERCNAACWRFNNSTNPNNGVSPAERARLFREILQPRDPVLSPPNASPVSNIGRVGENAVVEAPFHCDYGYNITIGQNVYIGRNCTILDSCEVKIGDNCSISPNVSIFTTKMSVDPKRRQGSKGPLMGAPVTIEQDCWIGGGVIILPGVTIAKGSTVGAGSLVTRDVPQFTVVVGSPATVCRGIGS